jgi:hypothetical protein
MSKYGIAEKVKKDIEDYEDKLGFAAFDKATKYISCNKEFIAMIDEKLEQISKRPKYSEQKSEDEIYLLALRDLAERNLK